MLGYVMVGTNDLDRSIKFYDQLLKVIGLKRTDTDDVCAGYVSINGPGSIEFYITKPFNNNIPELVDNTSPAVVNITSKREVTYSNQDYFRGMPEEWERFFGIPRDFGQQPQTRETVAYGSGFFFREN